MRAKTVDPRLLTKAQAAAYCQMSPANFDRLCSVKPLRFSERLVLFDVADIDAWIDRLKSPSSTLAATDWLDRMDHGKK